MSKCSFDLIWDQEAKTHILAEDAICCDASTWLTVLKKRSYKQVKNCSFKFWNSIQFYLYGPNS